MTFLRIQLFLMLLFLAFLQNTIAMEPEIAKTDESPKPPYRVLCFDGGGTRGIGTAELTRVLALNIKEKMDLELHDFFDLIVGTSTGGILAGCVTMGLPSEKLVNIYESNADRIFSKNLGRGLTGPEYDKDKLKEVIPEYIEDAKNKTLKDAKTNFAFTTYEPKTFKTRLFTSTPHIGKENQDLFNQRFIPGGHIPIIKGIRMTTAAPGYFKGASLHEGTCLGKPKEGKRHAFVDGGLGASNPTPITYDYLQKLKADGVIDKSRKIQLISFGTGFYDGEDFKADAGYLSLVFSHNLIHHCMHGGQMTTNDCFEEKMKKAMSKGKIDYFRINFKLNRHVNLATTDPEVLKEMINAAAETTKSKAFDTMLKVLLG